jgi:hypothetical protein
VPLYLVMMRGTLGEQWIDSCWVEESRAKERREFLVARIAESGISTHHKVWVSTAKIEDAVLGRK